MKHQAILLPGAVLPAEPAYAALVDALGADAEAVPKNLELYAGDEPPPGYTLDDEIEGVLREADRRGWGRFHLVGYSGGGASVLAVTAREPERVASLALLEPAWAGSWDLSPGEQAARTALGEIQELPPAEFMAAFARIQLRPGVDPPAPPPGDPPPWMAKRPPGIRALSRTFATYDLDREALERFRGPVYYALGALSNPDYYEELAARLARVFSDFELEVFEERHHFDPPHRVEPDRLARSLRALWGRASSGSS